MRDVVEIARTMGPEQLFLALVFLASYSLALGEFADRARSPLVGRVRRWSRRAAFAALSHPWEAGIVLVACASVGMALFSATVWALSVATTERAPRAVAQAPAANLPRARAVPSSRSVKNAPILNSPAAE